MMPTHDELRALFDYDPATGWLTWKNSMSGLRAGTRAGWPRRGDSYRCVTVGGRDYREHRLIWTWMTGESPPMDMDHRNRLRSDNRWANLRLATRTQNCANQAPRRDVPKGVFFNRRANRWYAKGRANKKHFHLGTFLTKEAAAAARLAWAKATFGEFACEGSAA